MFFIGMQKKIKHQSKIEHSTYRFVWFNRNQQFNMIQMHIITVENQFPFIVSHQTFVGFPTRFVKERKKRMKIHKNSEIRSSVTSQMSNHSSVFGTTVEKNDIKFMRNVKMEKIQRSLI